MPPTTRTWERHFPQIYPRKEKIISKIVTGKPPWNSQKISALTCAMAYSQRRLRPSNRYWSAALRRSCATSKFTSTDPVYMYLQAKKLVLKNERLTSRIWTKDVMVIKEHSTSSSTQKHPIGYLGSLCLWHLSPAIHLLRTIRNKVLS